MRWLRPLRAHMPITVKVPIVVVLLDGGDRCRRVRARAVAPGRVAGAPTRRSRQRLSRRPRLAADRARPARRPLGNLRHPRPGEAASTPRSSRSRRSSPMPPASCLPSSNPRHAAIGSRLPADFPADEDHVSKVLIRNSDARAFIDRQLVVEGRQIGTLHAELDISPLLAERREVLWTLIASNAALTLLFAALGWFAVRRMVAPMKVLAEHLETARDGSVEPIPESAIPGRRQPKPAGSSAASIGWRARSPSARRW